VGDGIIRKHAIIINSDTEARHLANVKRAVKAFKRGGYRIHAANPHRPKTGVYRHVIPTRSNVAKLIAGVRKQIDDDDQLVIYNTGHGDNGKEICLKDGCIRNPIAKQLDTLPYGQRTVIIDSCYGGNLARFFTNDARTLFVSAGIKGKQVCCNNFAPVFWKNAAALKKKGWDLNKDGVISWQERFAAAYKGHKYAGRLFLQSKGYKDYGVESGTVAKPAFPSTVTEVSSNAALRQQLKKLKPGQYAVFGFSLPGCTGCDDYKPKFKEIARKAGGRHLFLWTKSRELFEKYRIQSVPRVLIIDAFGSIHKVFDKDRIIENLSELDGSIVGASVNYIVKYIAATRHGHAHVLSDVLKNIAAHAKSISPWQLPALMPRLRILFGHKKVHMRDLAIAAYRTAMQTLDAKQKHAEAAKLRKLFNHRDATLRYTALRTYGEAGKYLAPNDVWLGSMKMLPHLWDAKEFVRLDAARALGKLAPQLQLNWAMFIAEKLKKLFGDKNNSLAYFTREAYIACLDVFPPKQILKEAKSLRSLIIHGSKSASRNARVAYEHIAPRLTSHESAAGALALHSLLRKPYSIWVSDVYSALLPHFDKTTVNREARFLRSLFNMKIITVTVARRAYFLYKDLAKRISPREAVHGIRAIRKLTPHMSIAAVYRILASRITDAQARSEFYAISPLLTSSRRSERELAAFYVAALAPKLSTLEAAYAAMKLRLMFRDRDPDVSWLAIDAYGKLAPKLTQKDVALGLSAIRTAYATCASDNYKVWGNIHWENIKAATKKLAAKIDKTAAMAEAARLRRYLTHKNSLLRRYAITAYSLLAPKLTSVEIATTSKLLRSSFGIVDDTMGCYAQLGRWLPSTEIEQGAALMRTFIGKQCFLHCDALSAIGLLAPYLKQSTVRLSAGHIQKIITENIRKQRKNDVWKLRNSFRNPGIPLQFLRVLAQLLPKLTAPNQRKAIASIQWYYERNLGRLEREKILQNIAPHLSSKELAAFAAQTRRLMLRERSSKEATRSYKTIIHAISSAEALKALEVLRTIFTWTRPSFFLNYGELPRLREEAIKMYATALGRIHGNARTNAIKELRSMLADKRPNMRYAAARTYGNISHLMNSDEAAKGAAMLRTLVADKTYFVRRHAIAAYGKIAKRLNRAELIVGKARLESRLPYLGKSDKRLVGIALKAIKHRLRSP